MQNGIAGTLAKVPAVTLGFWIVKILATALGDWAAFILTRPLGATLGDYLDKPVADGGLAMSRPLGTAALFLIIAICIAVFPQRAGKHPEPSA
jgi:uncharacterized membrane-anchored protein